MVKKWSQSFRTNIKINHPTPTEKNLKHGNTYVKKEISFINNYLFLYLRTYK